MDLIFRDGGREREWCSMRWCGSDLQGRRHREWCGSDLQGRRHREGGRACGGVDLIFRDGGTERVVEHVVVWI